MPDTRRVKLPGWGRRDKQNAPRTGVCVSRRWARRGQLLWGLWRCFRGNPVPWHGLGTRRLCSAPVALAWWCMALPSLGPVSANPTVKFKWSVYSEKQWVRMWGSHTGECVKENAHPTGGLLSVPHPGVRDRTSRQLALSEEFTPKSDLSSRVCMAQAT